MEKGSSHVDMIHRDMLNHLAFSLGTLFNAILERDYIVIGTFDVTCEVIELIIKL